MIHCQNCGFENSHDARFCTNCGRALELVCGNCSTSNSPESNFCKHCGNRLAPPLEDKSDLRSDSPASQFSFLADPADESQRSDYDTSRQIGQRRLATILFCDIKGSTPLAEQIDPEDWAELIQGAFGVIIPAIRRYEGTVARLMGDAILAFFGAPVAHEDDPYRAVRASLDIQRDYRPYYEQISAGLRQRGIVMDESDFDVRIGIHTGLVVLGEVGVAGSVEYTAIGDAANTAHRMQETARPGTIQVSEETYREVAPYIQAEPLGGIQVKGKRDPVQAYRVAGLRPRPTWVRAGDGAGSPLVGRERELRQLQKAIDDLTSGEGSVVSLIGEAGLGKTRLAQEVLSRCTTAEILHNNPAAAPDSGLDGSGLICYETASLSFETRQPYGMIKRLIRNAFGAAQEESDQGLDDNLVRFTATLPEASRPGIERAFHTLFSIGGDSDEAALPGEDIRHEILSGVTDFWRIQASAAPTLLVMDDVHWVDPASAELLIDLLAVCDESPLSVLLIFRPDIQSSAWKLKQKAGELYPHCYSEISLEPLLPWESDRLAAKILQTDTVPEDIRFFIQDRTEGNPFFIEELVMELVERGMIVQDTPSSPWRLMPLQEMVRIPDSIQSLLLARVDRLEPEVQKTLQYASVIGRTFQLKVLARTAATERNLDEHLKTLQRAGMIRRINRPPEVEYSFLHTIVQEAIYNAILIKDRRRYHQRVGEAMQEIYQDRLEQSAPLLAYHFDQAGNAARALPYFILAGENAMRLYADSEAIEHLSSALSLATAAGLDPEARSALLRKRGRAYETGGEFDNALADYQEGLALGREEGNDRIVWQASLDLGQLWAARDYSRAEPYLIEALAIARRLGDPEALAHSLNRMGNWYVNAERPHEGLVYHEEALKIFEEVSDQHGIANTLDLLGMATYLGGDIVKSADFWQRATSSFRALGDRFALVSSLASLSLTSSSLENAAAFYLAEPDVALGHAKEALEIASQTGWRSGEAYSQIALGSIYNGIGDFGQALEYSRAAYDTASRIEHKQWMAGGLMDLGIVLMELFDLENSLDHLSRGVQLANEIASGFWINLGSAYLALCLMELGEAGSAREVLAGKVSSPSGAQSIAQRTCLYARAHIDLAEGDCQAALETTDGLIHTAANLPDGKTIPHLWLARAKALACLSRQPEAEVTLLEALGDSRLRPFDGIRWRLQACLAEVYRSMGRPELAEIQSSAARTVLGELSRTIPDEDLRRKYLAGGEKVIQA
ncbi:MAG TPA: adenylate/guanylate cyclase domain-containing protein [Anaerolineales bacterium]|nr:adenylate/guanylate cyclase domain-containing protein [Anaerolineales bacterium]